MAKNWAIQVAKARGEFELVERGIPQLLLKRRAIQGWPSGTALDSEETLQLSAFSGVRPMIETYKRSRTSAGASAPPATR